MTDQNVAILVEEGNAKHLLGELDLAKQLPPRIPDFSRAVPATAGEKTTEWQGVDLRNRAIMG